MNNLIKQTLGLIAIFCLFSCQNVEQFEASVSPSMEDKTHNGKPYTPGTQSFLRGHHWLENIQKVSFSIKQNKIADIDFTIDSSKEHYFKAKNIPLRQLVPRLHYKTKAQPDEFDYFNLMLAEYSRNGISFPYARKDDAIPHFETNLKADIPWHLSGDYAFTPNPTFKPVRFSVVNNCLSPGLWEMNASDKTGEIYHGWMQFPMDKYYNLVADVNKITPEAAKQALEWKDQGVIVDLERLRTVKKVLGKEDIKVISEEISYSSQDSRRKLSGGFVTCEKEAGRFEKPENLTDMIAHKVKMSKFENPGKYSINNKMEFDFSYLGKPIGVKVSEVEPLTYYNYDQADYKRDNMKYVEIEIELPENRKLILGNIPLNLLVQKEDFAIHGFGVGILSSSDFAERRQFLINQGYHPSFAYFVKETPEGLMALNSHGEGLEQIFIRSFAKMDKPCWDITFTSYERITDIVKYRIPIISDLVTEQIAHHENYITPVYFSYRDDNLR